MSYADGLLATGERITHRAKQHPFIFVWGARFAILAVIIAALSLWLSTNSSGTFQTILGWVTVILFLGGLAVFVWTALRYVNQEYVLTNRRVIQVEGVLNRKSTDSSLEKINDALLSQSVFGRMLDFGDLTVLTASESAIDKMKMLRGPVRFKKAMLDAKHEYEVDMERAGWAPSPPIREGMPPGAEPAPVMAAAQPGPATSAPAPSAPRADPDEVTRTLASLAGLRDSGAISPEEYERKKAELLARL
jgi:PH (Pleckstrin Homology) domain-containing protein/putative oligomerization/nucleic acid binding protein